MEKGADWQELQWVPIPCQLCGSTDYSVYKVYRTLPAYQEAYGPGGVEQQVVKCASCGLVYNNPRPPREGFLSLSSTDPHTYRPMSVLLSRRKAFFECELARLRKHVPTGRWLDVGCNYGIMMRLAADAGYEVHGNDVQPRLVKAAREELGLENVMLGDLLDLKLAESHFDVITAYAVIEHVYDPIEMLREMRRLLAPGGVVRCCVPNVESRHAQTIPEWWEPYHFTFFSAETLRAALNQVGFVRVEISATPYAPAFVRNRQAVLYKILRPAIPTLMRAFSLLSEAAGARVARLVTGSGLYATAREA